ncbi:MAG TPA: shikimate kinase [Abditibacteriaceae bacterium]|jgi:shikimate kinase|nr:shikimate kinase [Abditibacteriaceae bacterium]
MPDLLPDNALNSSRNSLGTVVLIGFMGCGKTSVARRLASRLKWPSIDLDFEIEQALGTTITQFFRSHGEDAFRARETLQLRQALGQSGIVATGGGIVTREENRKLLHQSRRDGTVCVVYLRARPETLATRIRRQPGVRPLVDGERILNWFETRERVRLLLAERTVWYEECADLTVDGDALSCGQVARIIAAYVAPDGVNFDETEKDEKWPNEI